jgi:hypothetical protein
MISPRMVKGCVWLLNGIFQSFCVGNVTQVQCIKNSAVINGAAAGI